LFASFIAAMLILGGCAQMEKKERICPGKESAEESLALLKSQSGNAVPLKADGQCLLQYYTEDKKPKKENFPVKLWVNPPAEIYMQGDVAFDPKGVILGSNEREFWLAVRLKEVSGYWWGRWSERNHPEKLMISPRLVLEALGTAAVGDEKDWSLSKDGAFDVLTKRESGTETKKIYINNCDCLVRKIEYLGKDGQAAIAMELDKHKEISKNFFVPGVVRIVNRAGGSKGDSVQITLSSVRPADFTDKQRERLFVRPQAQGFRQVFEIVDGKVIEQPK
jgi:hypothetical protein